MDRGWVLGLILIGIFAGVFVVLYSAVMGTTSMTDRVFNESNARNTMQNPYYSYFSISKLRYYDRALAEHNDSSLDRCSMNISEEAMIIELYMSTLRHPQECDVLVDNKYSDHFSIEDPHHVDETKDGVMFHSVVVKEQDIYRPHNVMVCCENICRDARINPLC